MQTLTDAPAPDTQAAAQAPDLAPISIVIPTLRPGERYAGITLDDDGNPTHHLLLMAERPGDRLKWQAAMDWAASIGGTLPTRQELSLLYANCKAHIKPEWTWSCQTHEEDASCAWDCNFFNGGQLSLPKSYEGSAVAVRRLPINPSIL